MPNVNIFFQIITKEMKREIHVGQWSALSWKSKTTEIEKFHSVCPWKLELTQFHFSFGLVVLRIYGKNATSLVNFDVCYYIIQ